LALSTGVDNGKYTFVPEPNFVGTVSLGQTVCDNGTPQACDNATLLLTSIPSQPIANPDINQTPEGKPTNGNLLTNDEGFDLSVTTVTVSGGTPVTVPTDGSSVTIPIPGKGTITVDKTGEYTFTPEPGFTGEVPPIEYLIEDGNGLTDESTLIIQVIPTYNPNKNNPPVANDDYVTTTIDKPVTGDLTGNDSDPDKDPLTVTEIKVPANGGGTTTVNVPTDGSSTPSIDVYDGTTKVGTITVNKDGEFTFTPEDDFVGKVPPITYQVCDDGTPKECDTAELEITVVDNHGKNVTYANDDANSAKRGETMTGNVLDNDTDPEGNTQTVTGATSNGTTIVIGTETTITGVGKLTLNSDGTYTFIPNSDFVGTVPVVYTVCDNGVPQACDNATLYLTTLSSVNYWLGGKTGKENDWNTPENWTDNRVPGIYDDVEFATTANNNGVPAKDDLHVPTGTPVEVGDLTNRSSKNLIVPPSSTIIVHGEVVGSENPEDVGKIVIEADKTTHGTVPNGSFIALNACGNYDVYATVELWAQGQKVDETIKWTDNITGSPTAGTGLSSSHSWQHFGVPVENVVALDAFYDSWIQKYSEPQNGNIYGTGGSSTFYDKWNKVTPYETLNMFEGYEITQDVPTYYTIKGKLFFCDKTLTLTRKAVAVVGASGVNEHYALGQNVFGNSYTAAINLDNGIIFNDSEVEQTVYIYRTGSFQNWGNEGGIVTTATTPNAGSYIAIPAKVGSTVWGNQIPSLQGFLLKFTNSETLYNQSDKTVTLKYIDGGVVGNTRPQLTQKAPLSHLTVTLKSKSTVDRAWLFSQEGTSDKFDNGWDGTKYFGTPTAFIYSESPFGKLQVNTSNTIDKKILSILPNRDTAYELILDKTNLEEYEDLHLIDLVERKAISLNDERTVYNFTANHPNRAVKRFIIANSANIDMNSNEFKLVDGYLENNNELVLSNLTSAIGVAHLVDLSGKLIGTYSMKHAVTRVPVSLIRGVYVLHLEADGEVENVKLIVK
jgi:CshA-type fibril repeat protein